MPLLRTSLAVALLVLSAGESEAASISIDLGKSTDDRSVVVVRGAIEPEDDKQFLAKIGPLSKAIVVFQSEGGNLLAGLRIGEAIRLKGFHSLVLTHCASACALAWLGGVQRFMSAAAKIGFHAAYDPQSRLETGVGNALVGAYLNSIGLPYSAVVYVTGAAPSSMTWLTAAEAKRRGIDVAVVSIPENVETPGLGVATTPTGPKDVEKIVNDFIASLFNNWSRSNAEALAFLASAYDEDLLYFGKHVSREVALEDQRQFVERWPKRSYNVRPGTLAIKCWEPTRAVRHWFCDVNGMLDWNAFSADRHSSGNATFSYSVTIRDGTAGGFGPKRVKSFSDD